MARSISGPPPSPSLLRVREAQARGARAEQLVVDYLEERGVAIVARNLRLGHLEIDIVARDGPLIAVVEVRTRSASSLASSLGSIGITKRLRIRRAGNLLWARRYRRDPSVTRLRYDVAVVHSFSGKNYVEYIPAAF